MNNKYADILADILKELHDLLMTTDCGSVCCVVCANDRKKVKQFFIDKLQQRDKQWIEALGEDESGELELIEKLEMQGFTILNSQKIIFRNKLRQEVLKKMKL